MKNLAQVFVTGLLSLVLMAGVGLTLTGCSADSLSGPDIEANAAKFGGDHGGGGGTTGTGSAHNTDKAGGDHGGGGGTTGTGSAHNTDG